MTLDYYVLFPGFLLKLSLSEIKKLSVFIIRIFLKKHFFITFRHITIDNIINMPTVIPPLAIRINVSVVVYYPSILFFSKNKCCFIKSISMIIYRVLIVECLIMSTAFRRAPLNIFITEHYSVAVIFFENTDKL